MPALTNKSLAEHMHLGETEIQERKDLLEFTPDLETELSGFHQTALAIAESVVSELYAHQISVSEIEGVIGDKDTLSRLKNAMQTYVVQLFNGTYGIDYVNSRLRIGKVHARIGVETHHYLSSVSRLQGILTSRAIQNGGSPKLIKALHKLLLFDTQFVIDTYIQGLVSEVEQGKDKLAQYAESLEIKVRKRTSEIERLARTDELTGLETRQQFLTTLTQDMENVRGFRQGLSLVFIDIDDFKTINDTRGHIEGDRVLKQVGKAIRKAFDGHGRGYRFGGDEFCILTKDSEESAVIPYIDALATVMPENVHMSYGIATMTLGSSLSRRDFISLADQAMYFNKAQNKTLRRA